MILYAKGAALRIRRAVAPEPPFWAATTVAPYGGRRAQPIAIDYVTLRASAAERLEVGVADHVGDDLERQRSLASPILIDAAGQAEIVFRRGLEALAFCERGERDSMFLTSTAGALPSIDALRSMTIVAVWPPDPARFRSLAGEARERRLAWGAVVPIVFPLTTALPLLEEIVSIAGEEGARFVAPVTITVEPTARQAIAAVLQLSPDDDRYGMLFHASTEPLQVATERHLASLAAQAGLADFVVPPAWEKRTNWNASILLTRTASRMLAMELDIDLAGQIARSARVVAELDKPIARIAEAASLSIIGSLDEVSAELLTSWIENGGTPFADYVDEQWRLRRDAGRPLDD